MEYERFFIKNLRAAILQQAVKDYLTALKSKNEKKSKELEKWFLSPYGQLLSGDQGQEIINRTRKIYFEKQKQSDLIRFKHFAGRKIKNEKTN